MKTFAIGILAGVILTTSIALVVKVNSDNEYRDRTERLEGEIEEKDTEIRLLRNQCSHLKKEYTKYINR